MPDTHSQWSRLDSKALNRLRALIRPWERLVDPHFSGLEHIPDERPRMFIGNHTLFGALDVPLMFFKLLDSHDIYLRPLVDHIHFKIPLWRTLFERMGGLEGTPENCDALIQASESLLIFPGGAREVAKRKNEEYQLVWGERSGFARHALRHGCTILPFAAIGAEDMFHIVADANNYLNSRIGSVLKRFGVREDMLFPLALPRALNAQTFERFYFHILPPIHVPRWEGEENEAFEQMAWMLREQTRESIEMGIEFLKEQRLNDPLRKIPTRRELGKLS